MTIYQKLVQICAENPSLLVSYKTDLTKHDLDTLEHSKAGERYIWVLRERGTQMHPLERGEDPHFVTYHIKNSREAQYYLITCAGTNLGDVVRISVEEAERLVKLPAKGPHWKHGQYMSLLMDRERVMATIKKEYDGWVIVGKPGLLPTRGEAIHAVEGAEMFLPHF
jgi:hypothetical protein